MFVWSVPTVLREFNRHAPELADFISQLRATGNFDKALRDRFSKLPRISFDYAIMEKADRVLVVEAGFDWDDIGSWRAVANYFEKDNRGNAANRAITAIDSSNNIVFEENGTTIALLGVHDLIVVRSLAGLGVDWSAWTAVFPPDSDAVQRDTVERFLMYKPFPQTGSVARFRRRWFGRIIDRYRGSRKLFAKNKSTMSWRASRVR